MDFWRRFSIPLFQQCLHRLRAEDWRTEWSEDCNTGLPDVYSSSRLAIKISLIYPALNYYIQMKEHKE